MGPHTAHVVDGGQTREMATPAARAVTTGRPRPTDRSLVWGFAVTETVSWGVLFYALPVLLVPMDEDLGWGRATIVGAYSLAIVVSGLAAPVVGRRLDRSDPRVLITGGSALAATLVLAWSQVTSPVALYAVWLAIGLVKAVVLYEAAFTVLIKRCAPHHRRAILTVTLTAGLASFIFQPLTSALTTAWGWRTALVVLAAVLGAVTVPVHWLVLRPRPPVEPVTAPAAAEPGPVVTGAGAPHPGAIPELRQPRYWLLTAAFTASATASFTTVVLLVAFLTDGGWTLGGAALATGVLGAMQLPGRLAFGPLADRLPSRLLAPALFSLPAAGLLLLLAGGPGPGVWPAVALLGIGQGTAILLRATLYVELYGTERIGVLNGISAVPMTLARAAAPFAGALVVAAVGGYTAVLWALIGCSATAALLAHRSLRDQDRSEEVSGAATPAGAA